MYTVRMSTRRDDDDDRRRGRGRADRERQRAERDRARAESLWRREDPRRGRGRAAPSREEIVEAALALADSEGFEAVSMRRLAQRLRTGTMTLYSYVTDKDDLVQLMLDEAMSEQVVPGALPTDWREAIKAIQRQTRAVFLAHPWLVQAMGSRVEGGPNTLRHVDQSLGALAPLDAPARRKLAILGALDDFTLGHAVREIAMSQRMNAIERQPDREAWLKAMQAYADDMIASGDYPHLAELAGAQPFAEANPIELSAELFEVGLDWMLAGIAASLERG
jgi:AcrR family transcriptional regulator